MARNERARKINIPLPNGTNLSIPVQEGTSLNKADVLVSGLLSGITPISVEYECGDCCNKIVNIADVELVGGVALEFFPPQEGCLVLKVFSGGKLAETRILNSIIVFIDQLISAEFNAVELPMVDKKCGCANG
ncbi:MAG: hypothetical protein ACOYI2_11080 [Bacillota bacterium]|jgi:hypothetical protein|nr:hypothetical protein [Clostridia bacterium]